MTRVEKLISQLIIIFMIVVFPAAAFAADEGSSVYESFDRNNISVKLMKTEFAYDGNAHKPKVVVSTLNPAGETAEDLAEGRDYKVRYENNKYPGTGRAVVEGMGLYSGKIEVIFKINMSKVTGLKVKKQYKKSVKLSWDKAEGVSGYRIYQIKSGVWQRIDDVEGRNHNYYTVDGLKPATAYTFAVKAYVNGNKDVSLSPMSERVLAGTGPEATKITDKTGLVCALKVKWNKKNCSGYEVWVSRNSSFSKLAGRKTVSSKYNQAYIYDLAKSEKYYVKVRPYFTRNGKKIYGNWSYYKTVTTKPISAGWNNIKGYKYYYSMGYALTGSQYINGNPYYFDSHGRLMGSSYKMWQKAKNASSSTNWLLVTDTHTNATGVYHWNGKWVLKRYMRCSTGAYKTPTIKGNFYVCSKGYSFSDEDYTCYYWTGFYGSEYLYHTVPYVRGSKKYILDGSLGVNISHGCVRLATANAKWIYNNIPYYTRVITF